MSREADAASSTRGSTTEEPERSEPRVDPEPYRVGTGCDRSELLAVAKVYAREVVATHDLAVDVSALEWELTARAQRRAGAVRYRDGDPEAVVLAWKQFQNRGWRATASTVRHELAHVHLLNEAGDPSHGRAFRRLAERLDTHVNCERFTQPNWWVVCTDCGQRLARYRRSKLVNHPEKYECGDCGGRFRVEENED